MAVKIFILSFYLISLSACFYDAEDKLYPNPPACDTVSVSYKNGLVPILVNNCYSCHRANSTNSVIHFEGYNELITVMQSRNFLGAIKRIPGVQAMPQGGDKLPDCEISIIESWINQGKQNN